jgi:Helix-turn-helix of DDE superfamily endonuclease
LPVSARLLLVLVHLPTNLTTRALAALFNTSQSAIDRTLHHLVPVLASSLQPDTGQHDGPWIIDGTLIPAHDQSITAPAKNYRRSINTQIIICCRHGCVVTVGQSWPGNRDVVVARNTVAPLLTGGRMVLGDGGYRGITTISTARRDQSGRTIRDQDCANTVGSGPASNMSSLDSRLADPAQCRRVDAINHSLQIIAGLWNLKTRTQLRVILARPRYRPERPTQAGLTVCNPFPFALGAYRGPRSVHAASRRLSWAGSPRPDCKPSRVDVSGAGSQFT